MEMIRKSALTKYIALMFIALCFGALIISQLTADREVGAPSIDQIKDEIEIVIAKQEYQRTGEIKAVDKIDLKLASVELSSNEGSEKVRSSYADNLSAIGWISDGHSGNGDMRQDHYCKGVLRLSLVPIQDARIGTHALYVAWTRIRSSRFYCRVS